MNKKSKRLLGNVGILTISNFSTKILSFFFVPLYTSILSTEDYGLFDLVTTTLELLIPILTLNISDAVMRFMLDKEKIKEQVARVGLKYLSISLLGATLVTFVCSRIVYFNRYSGMFIWIWLIFLFRLMHQFLFQYAKGTEHVKEIGIAGVLSTVISLSCNIFFLVGLGIGIKGFFISNVISTGLVVIFMIIRLRIWKVIRFSHVDNKLEKEMLVYCIPLITTAIAWWANSSLDKYVIAVICGVAANGIIAVAYKIPSIMNIVQSIFIQAWQISAIREYEDEEKNQFYEKTFLAFNFLLCMAGFGLIFLSRFIASKMFQADFYIAWKYVPFLIVASIINSASGFLGPILSAQKKTKVFATSSFVGLASNAILNCVLIYFIGIQGATIATVASSFLIYCVRKKACLKFITNSKHANILVQWLLLCLQSVVKIFEWSVLFELLIGIVLLGLNMVFIKDFLVRKDEN